MRSTTVMAIVAAVSAAGLAQAGQVFQESFESAPGATYTMSNQFDDGFFDFFDRYAVPDNINAARDDFQLGWDGQFGIMGQDHDGDGFAPTQSVTIGNIDITGLSGLSMTMSAGALDSEAAGFNNFEAADGDGISIFASIDAGPDVMIGRFSPPASGAGDLYLDTNMDGIGDGVNLTVALADFSFAIAGGGSSLSLRIEMTSTSSFEPIAIDNVRVFGVPTPGALALLGFAGMATTRRRRA
jgi:hypothetical protein